MTKRPVQRTARRVALLLASTVLAIGVAEVLVRWRGLAPEVVHVQKGRYQLSDNPLIGYEPTPGFSAPEKDATWFAYDFFDYRSAETNALGFRDAEHDLSSSPGSKRVVVLGDSIAVGLGIDSLEDIFPEVARRRLQEEGQTWEFINQAVVGYNTQQEVEAFVEKGLQYQPDVVLVAYCLNDRAGRSDGWLMGALLHEATLTNASDPLFSDALLRASALLRFVRYRLLVPSAMAMEAHSNERRQLISEDRVSEYLEKLANLSVIHDFEVLLVVFPFYGDPDLYGDLQTYDFEGEHAAVIEEAQALGMSTLDLLPDFQACERERGGILARDQVHPNLAGHACAGAAIARQLTELPGGLRP